MKKNFKGYHPKLNLIDTLEIINKVDKILQKKLINEFNLLKINSPSFAYKKNVYRENQPLSYRPINFDSVSIDSIFEIFNYDEKWNMYFLYKNDINEKYSGIFSKKLIINRDASLTNSNSFANTEINSEIILDKKDYKLDGYIEYVSIAYSIFKDLENEVYNLSKQKLSINLPENCNIYNWEELKKNNKNLTDLDILITTIKQEKIIFIYNLVSCKNIKDFNLGYICDLNNYFFNGAFLVYNEYSNEVYSIANLTYRVDSKTLNKQINEEKKDRLKENKINELILNEKINPSINIKIFRERFLLFMLEKCHISEVQPSILDKENEKILKENNIKFL